MTTEEKIALIVASLLLAGVLLGLLSLARGRLTPWQRRRLRALELRLNEEAERLRREAEQLDQRQINGQG